LIISKIIGEIQGNLFRRGFGEQRYKDNGMDLVLKINFWRMQILFLNEKN
jgi:hypothetical protein